MKSAVIALAAILLVAILITIQFTGLPTFVAGGSSDGQPLPLVTDWTWGMKRADALQRKLIEPFKGKNRKGETIELTGKPVFPLLGERYDVSADFSAGEAAGLVAAVLNLDHCDKAHFDKVEALLSKQFEAKRQAYRPDYQATLFRKAGTDVTMLLVDNCEENVMELAIYRFADGTR